MSKNDPVSQISLYINNCKQACQITNRVEIE